MKTVVILAPGRSGTSLLAGILHKLGVDMGDDGEEKSSYNPWGYFENKDFIN
ncbi:MAG: sulfotransferase family protein, partial [Candidatus Iainarchaeum archaeon]